MGKNEHYQLLKGVNCGCGKRHDCNIRYVNLADGILKRDEESIKTLMEALIIVGILMSFAGSSRPASGSEHHFSHFFEITGIIDNEDYLPHGIDVAYSTVLTAELREELLKKEIPEKIFRLSDTEYKKTMDKIYKSVADGCVELQNKVGHYKADRLNLYTEKQTEIKKILAECPTAKEIEEMLSLVGLDMSEFYNFYTMEKIENAKLYAKDLKDRYTVLWLYYDLIGE